VHKDFKLEPVRVEALDLGQAEFARENRAPKALPGERRQLLRAMRVELCAGMQVEIRICLAHERGKAKIGDDESVQAGLVRPLQGRQGRPQLVLFKPRVRGR
jgi:hypothetical protein